MIDPNLGPTGGVERVNNKLTDAALSAVNVICRQIMESTIDLVEDKLEIDAQTVKMMNGEETHSYKPGDSAYLFASPSINAAPSRSGETEETIGIVLSKNKYWSQEPMSAETHAGDTLSLFVPLPKDYEYPNPIDPFIAATRMYVAMDSIGEGVQLHEKFMIDQERGRYRVLRYDNAYTGREEIEDLDSVEELLRRIDEPLRDDLEVAGRIFRAIRNYVIMPTSSFTMNENGEWLSIS